MGEKGADTLIRELREELDVEIRDLRYLGALESIFTYNGQRGHEIVLVYDSAFADSSIYRRRDLVGREDDGSAFKAVWESIAELRSGDPLYPNGLDSAFDYLTRWR